MPIPGFQDADDHEEVSFLLSGAWVVSIDGERVAPARGE